MGGFDFRRRSSAFAVLALVAFAGGSAPVFAGTGRLVSHWMSRAPHIDGLLAADEWSEAVEVDIGMGIVARFGNDARTLYVAVLDPGDPGFGNGDGIALYFDDEGGTAPVLDDSGNNNPDCLPTPDLGEGVLFTFADQTVSYRADIHDGFSCNPVSVVDRLTFRAAGQPAGVTFELAIPLDGPAPLQALAGQRFAFNLRTTRGFSPAGCYPTCADTNPLGFRNLILASGGCNSGPQTFGSLPHLGLPLDWENDVLAGGGPGWLQAPPSSSGFPFFCDANVTGGTGSSACISNWEATSTSSRSLLKMPLTLAGQQSASLRARTVFVIDPNGDGNLDYFSIWQLLEDAGSATLVDWFGESHTESLDLALTLDGSQPVELDFEHETSSGGLVGGYAQVDDVELLCGPVLFADGFESGWATHWSAESP